MKKILLCVAVASLLGGCATTQYNYAPVTQDTSAPLIGVVAVASVGDPMLSQGRSKQTDVIVFAQDTNLPANRLVVSSGFLVKIGEDAEAEFYAASNREGSAKFRGSSAFSTPDLVESVRIAKATGEFSVLGKMPPPYGSVKLAEKTQIEFSRSKKQFVDPASFQQTLIYNGKAGSKVSIAYREFSGDMARPAFNNEAQYDLNESKVIGYKGARIEVINATNEQIEYKVLQNFNRATAQ